jgi:hypothetical protein
MAAKRSKRKKRNLDADRPDLRAATRVAVWIGVAVLLVVALHMGWMRLWGMLRNAPECQIDLQQAVQLPQWPDCIVPDSVQEAVAARLEAAELPTMSIVSRSKGRSPAQLVHAALNGVWWIKDLEAVRTQMPAASNQWKPRIVVDAVPFRSAAVVHWYNPATSINRQVIDRDGRWLGDELGYYKLPGSMDRARTPIIIDVRSNIPTPELGELWNREHFAVGARLCTLLHEGGLLAKLLITKIDVTHVGQGSRAPVPDGSTRPDVTLHTAGGAVIKWGCTDAYAELEGLRPSPDEPSDADKLGRLIYAVDVNPELADHRYVDLRYRETTYAPRVSGPER